MRIENNIFLNSQLAVKLLALIPRKVLNYWEIKIINIDKIEGGIRYNEHEQIDAIYIYVKTIFMEIDDKIPRAMIKFNIDNDEYTFDSVYSQYDPLEKKIICPAEEYRYDSEMNIIGKYTFNIEPIKKDNSGEIRIGVQYKNEEKLKEYFFATTKISTERLNELDDAGIITRKVKHTNDIDINYIGVYDKNIIHYHIR